MALFQPGAWIWSRSHGASGQILEADELWGQQRYRVWFPSLNTVLLQRPEELLHHHESPKGELTGAGSKVRFAAIAGRVIELLNDDKLLAPIDSSVIPLPHQIRALRKVLSNPGRVRYLMADEVGLGKTIEAGLTIRELKLRGLIKRVLVVAPKGLIPQWIVEMKERFGEDFRHFDPGQFDAYRQISHEENIWRTHDRVICSMDAVKPLDSRKGWSAEKVESFNRDRILGLASAGWDMIVIDESHRVGGSSDTVARYAMAKMLAEAAPSLLLLSATPHQGKTDAFHRLMTLLDKEAFPNESSVNRERVAPYVVRTEKRQTINHDGTPLFKPRLTKLVSVSWEGHREQRELYDAVTEYIREGYNQAMKEKKTHVGFLMILMQRLVSSSTRAIATTLEKRLAVLNQPTGQMELFPEESEWEEMDGQEQLETILSQRMKALDNEKEEVQLLLSAAKRVEGIGPDAKAKALLEWVYKMQEEEQDPSLKILIFTEFVPTQAMLAEFLRSRGMSVVCLNGSMDLEERKHVQKRFSEDVQIMISTDAGGEGLNLQFCHVIINFDLGWRPMALEQRIGRLDRIGQKHVVKALNFLLEDSVEYRIQEVIQSKLKTIFEEFGVDKTTDLLDSIEGARMFDRLFIEALMHPERLNEDVAQFAESFRHESVVNRDSKIFTAEVGPSGMDLEAVSTQPLGDLLEMLVKTHLESVGGKYHRQPDGAAELIWPGESKTKQVHFPGNRDGTDGELLNLDHPKIRSLIERIPVMGKGEPIPQILGGGLSKSAKGYWSLWVMRFASFDFRQARVFPVFINNEGKVFGQTARHLWEKITTDEIAPSSTIEGEEALSIYNDLYAAAVSEGRQIWETLKRLHLERWKQEMERTSYHFTARRKMLDQIGLKEVRGYRLRQLEVDEAQRLGELDRQKNLLPELDALTMVVLSPA
jgi:superfamily II DNA or RNA helicase